MKDLETPNPPIPHLSVCLSVLFRTSYHTGCP